MSEHIPVLLQEIIDNLKVKKGEVYIDATLGAGGHSSEIVKLGGKLLGIEADESMLKVAEPNLQKACPGPYLEVRASEYFKLVKDNFMHIESVFKDSGLESPAGIIFDLGISSLHYTDLGRGFSFSAGDELLDMRLSPDTQSLKASDLLNALRVDQLTSLFAVTVNSFKAKKLSEKVVAKRNQQNFEKVGDFLTLFPEKKKGKIHPATKAFLALRIAVNSEFENLEAGLKGAITILKKGGRLLVISFHSEEDRKVKELFKAFVGEGRGKLVTDKPILPTEGEINANPRARSAKLRIIEKT